MSTMLGRRRWPRDLQTAEARGRGLDRPRVAAGLRGDAALEPKPSATQRPIVPPAMGEPMPVLLPYRPRDRAIYFGAEPMSQY
jgi:hypothetical protein